MHHKQKVSMGIESNHGAHDLWVARQHVDLQNVDGLRFASA